MNLPLCPSAEPAPGTRILAIETTSGELAYVQNPVYLSEEAAERLARNPDARPLLRFAAPCQEGRCKQWTGSRCGVTDRVGKQLVTLRRHSLPACGIRPSCRWFEQRGQAACQTCAAVRTVIAEPAPSASAAGARADVP